MRIAYYISHTILLTMLLVSCAGEETTLLPSEAMDRISEEYRQTMTGTETRQEAIDTHVAIAQEWLERVETEDLSREERLVYADILLTAKQTEEGTAIIHELSEGDDLVARKAWVNRLMEDFFEGRDEVFREAIDEYHQRFQPIPEDLSGIYRPLQFAVIYHQEHGSPEVAMSLVDTHLAWLKGDAPYSAWKLLIDVKPIYEQQDDLAAWEALRDEALLDLRAGHVHGSGAEMEREYHELVDALIKGERPFSSPHGVQSPH